MKKIVYLALVAVILCAGIVCAEQAAFTGADYLKLTGPQRVAVVNSFKANVKKQGVEIKKDAVFYCKNLDGFYAKNPKMQRETFDKIMQTLAIMEYDWSQKGIDKDDLARTWLGENTYNANKARLKKK